MRLAALLGHPTTSKTTNARLLLNQHGLFGVMCLSAHSPAVGLVRDSVIRVGSCSLERPIAILQV